MEVRSRSTMGGEQGTRDRSFAHSIWSHEDDKPSRSI
jgi:hypothetical protein